jgi:hypothetical protein
MVHLQKVPLLYVQADALFGSWSTVRTVFEKGERKGKEERPRVKIQNERRNEKV